MASRPPDPTDALARQRWLAIQLLRVAGFGLVLLGIVMARGVVDLAGSSNALLGYIFILIGLADGFVMPVVLARRWSSRKR